MESFPWGFKRDDPSTYTNAHMPIHIKGGMLHGYGIAHEDWSWKIRTSPGVIDAFAKVWGTRELVTSFDSAAVMLPHRNDIPKDVSLHVDVNLVIARANDLSALISNRLDGCIWISLPAVVACMSFKA